MPLLAALGNGPGLLTRDLEVAAEAGPPEDYGLATEVTALDRFGDDRGLDRLHLYGYPPEGPWRWPTRPSAVTAC